MAAMVRMSGSLVEPLLQELLWEPSRKGLIALAPVQTGPELLPGPRHTRQVPISSWDASSGSTRNGAGNGMDLPSPPTSAFVTAGPAPKSDGVQEPPCEQR